MAAASVVRVREGRRHLVLVSGELATAGGRVVDGRRAAGNGLGVWPACGVAALGALGLRQQVLEDVGERLGHGGCRNIKDAIIVQKG